MTDYTIDAVLFEREHGHWVAQCLQHDIGAQASSPEDLAYEFQKALVAHIAICLENGAEPFVDLPAAPREYWDEYDRSKVHLTVNEGTASFRLQKPVSVPKARMKLAAAV